MLECSYLEIFEQKKLSLGEDYSRDKFLSNIHFHEDLLYDIAIDQSSSCTGLFIASTDMTHYLIAELTNGGLDYVYYKRYLLSVLRKLFTKTKFRYFIMEDPLKYSSGRQNPKLIDLKKSIISFINEEKHGFSFEHFAKIQPQSWRAGLLRDVNEFFINGDGEPICLKKTSKRATAFTIMKNFPETKEFLSVCHNPTEASGYDGFDAAGILLGYRKRFGIKEDSKITKIQGSKTSLSASYGIFFDCTTEDEKLKMLSFLDFLSEDGNLGKPQIKIYNDEEILYNNIKMAITSADGVNTKERFVVSKVTDPLAVVQLCSLFSWLNTRSTEIVMIVIPIHQIKRIVTETVETYTDYLKVY